MQILAHRGASHYAPENTQAAFDLALEMGSNGIETDLHLTRDGRVALIHDKTVDRTTDGTGAVAGFTLAELQALDAGSSFDLRYAGQRVMELGTFLQRYAGRVHLALEFKAAEAVGPGLELVERLHGLQGITFTSFQFDMIAELRRRNRSARIGWLVPAVTPEVLGALADIGAQQVCPQGDRLTAADVALAKQGGLEVRAWGIRDEEVMRHAVACGADGMTINFPDLLVRHLNEK